jgi:hypothetical protein
VMPRLWVCSPDLAARIPGVRLTTLAAMAG